MTEHLSQGVKDAQDKFNAGMGADGDASPYPILKELRAKSPCIRVARDGDRRQFRGGPQTFTAYTFDAVKAIFTDNETFSTRCYEASSGRSRARPSSRCRNPNTRCTESCTNSPSLVPR